MVPHNVRRRDAPDKRYRAAQLLRPPEDHPLSADASRDADGQQQELPDVPVLHDPGAGLFERSVPEDPICARKTQETAGKASVREHRNTFHLISVVQ